MKRIPVFTMIMLLVSGIAFAQDAVSSDPVLRLDVVRVEAKEVSPIAITRLHERFPDQLATPHTLHGTVLLDTLRPESFRRIDPFQPIDLPPLEELLSPSSEEGPSLEPNN
ncbi:hypothetical protein KQI63_08375 [bacterium]|nr:hypothetical protein [bacterium]